MYNELMRSDSLINSHTMEKGSNLVLQFDDLVRCFTILLDDSCEKEFLRYISNQELVRLKWVEMINECKRLKDKLDSAEKDISVLDSKLISARRWLDDERQQRKQVELERDAYTQQLEEVRRIILSDPKLKLSDEAKEKLSILSRTTSGTLTSICGTPAPDRLNTIAENESVMSYLSDVSFSRSENEIDDMPRTRNAIKKHLPRSVNDEPVSAKKRRSSVRSTPFYTPTAPRVELIQSLKRDEVTDGKKVVAENGHEEGFNRISALEQINSRMHSFVSKTNIMPDTCSWCLKRTGFGRVVFRCVDCNSTVHPECRDKVPLPCIPMGTPTKKAGPGSISDYAPSTPPMIPAIVVHCINEIELRGLTEIGIYRISGTEAVVRGLREKFSKGKGIPTMSDIDIHSVCCCLKDFLRNLQDPLIPRSMWNKFAGAISHAQKEDELRDAIQSLPQANRDTLAFIIIHLQKVACSPYCKMTVFNLATVFGPTIVGYSNEEQMSALMEAHVANAIMEELLLLPNSYWNDFISNFSSEPKTPCTLLKTPSLDSLLKKSSRKALATPGSRIKFFKNSPPL